MEGLTQLGSTAILIMVATNTSRLTHDSEPIRGYHHPQWGSCALEELTSATALSSAEAEIYASAEAAKCGRFFNWRCEEMGMTVKWPLLHLPRS